MQAGYCMHQWKVVDGSSLPFSKKDCQYVICSKCFTILEDRRRKKRPIDHDDRRDENEKAAAGAAE